MKTINSTFETRRFKIYILKRHFLERHGEKEEKENNEIGLHKKFY